ncbi:tryptophan transporter [Ornithinibacillus bavariensis]|uniref:Tryptophan transport protein n=1 Tax=Ornithinibacillus bavariensis TaxID=545502 RepID=A0A920C4G7_9BACI|nr:tryptophan transporter [Ornithinibacillus bavariensis]GIO25691.1 putative tryptophan transport protein [Ornithinibacillus bavariensis]HAM79902.1 tryptophan transporter [Ornithinibacillus sp.]
MNTRILVILSLLVGIGAVLHFIMPPIYGVTPDMMLAMMFIGIMLFPKLKYVSVLAIATGILSGLTSNAPGGQIANIIEKPVTALIFFALFLLVKDRLNSNIAAPVLTAVGTLISGSIFLSLVFFVIGLMDGAFLFAFTTAVLPAAGLNTVLMVIIYPVVQQILKRSKPITV